MNTVNQKILAIGQGITVLWMSGMTAVNFLLSSTVNGTFGSGPNLAFLFVSFGVLIFLGVYSISVVASRKRPRASFVILVASHITLMLVLLLLTLAFSYVSIGPLGESLGPETIVFVLSPTIGLVLILSSLAAVIYRTIKAKRSQVL